MGQAKNRAAQIAQLKTSEKPRPLFDIMIGICKDAGGWTSGYHAKNVHAINKVLFPAVLAMKPEQRVRLLNEMDQYTKFDYRGGVADLVSGAMAVLGVNPRM